MPRPRLQLTGSCGGATVCPFSVELAPRSQSATSEVIFRSSLRMVNSMSLPPICGGTLNFRLTIPGWPASVGRGLASSSANRLVSKTSRGMCRPASEPPVRPPGSRLK